MAFPVITNKQRAGTAFNDYLSQLGPGGGKIWIPPTTLTIDTKVTIANHDYVDIYASGKASQLIAKVGLNDAMFEIDWATVKEVRFDGILYDGNKANQTSLVGVGDAITYKAGTTGKSLILRDCLIQNTRGSGIDYYGAGLTTDNVEITNADEHGIALRGGSSGFHAKGKLYVHNCANQGVNLGDNNSNPVTDISFEDLITDSNTKNGLAGFQVNKIKISKHSGSNNGQSGLDIESATDVTGGLLQYFGNSLRGAVFEAYDGSNWPTTWTPSSDITISDIIGHDNGWGLLALQEAQYVGITNIEGYNNSAVQNNIGALIELRYNPGHTYNAARRNLHVKILNAIYSDRRNVSNSTYAIAMNGTNGVSAGGDYISVVTSDISGTTSSKIRFINDGTTSNNTIIDDR